MPRPYFNLFISWSGDRSRYVAGELREWIPAVVQTAEPFMSETDIEKGARSLEEIAKALDGARLGITCLTPENLSAVWLYYEAGAISKAVDDPARLCTFLLGGLRPEDVKGPLGQFQATRPEKEDTRKLIRVINKAVSKSPMPESRLDHLFDGMWPQLETKLDALPQAPAKVDPRRSPEDMISEILEIVRADHSQRKKVDWMDEYLPIFKDFFPLLQLVIQNAKQAGFAASQSVATKRIELDPTPATRNEVYDSGVRGDEKPKGE